MKFSLNVILMQQSSKDHNIEFPTPLLFLTQLKLIRYRGNGTLLQRSGIDYLVYAVESSQLPFNNDSLTQQYGPIDDPGSQLLNWVSGKLQRGIYCQIGHKAANRRRCHSIFLAFVLPGPTCGHSAHFGCLVPQNPMPNTCPPVECRQPSRIWSQPPAGVQATHHTM